MSPATAAPLRTPVETRLFLVSAAVATIATTLGAAALDAGDQLLFLAIPALLAGLPHGALDPVVARAAGVWTTPRGAVGFHLAYLALAAAVVGAWAIAPAASLGAFLLATAWHFSGDWRDAAGPLARVAAGLALVGFPAAARPEVVAELYVLVAGPNAAAIADVQRATAPLVGAVLAVALATTWRNSRRVAVEISVVAALALIAPPLLFFLVYFCALHSPRHLREGAALDGAARTAVVYSLIAAAGMAIVGALLAPRMGLDAAVARTVFVGLAALTAPHMLLVEAAQQRAVLVRRPGA